MKVALNVYAVADLREARGMRDPVRGSKFFQFYAVFGIIWQNRMLARPGRFTPPPRGNPGSATGMESIQCDCDCGNVFR